MGMYETKKVLVAEDGFFKTIEKSKKDFRLRKLYPRKDVKEIEDFYRMTIREFLVGIGFDSIINQRLRIVSSYKNSSVSHCVSDVLNDVFMSMGIPLKCGFYNSRQAEKRNLDKDNSIYIIGKDKKEEDELIIVFTTESCEVPKVQANSPTTGLRVVNYKVLHTPSAHYSLGHFSENKYALMKRDLIEAFRDNEMENLEKLFEEDNDNIKKDAEKFIKKLEAYVNKYQALYEKEQAMNNF